jgi:ParB family chromosome partitioning protein
MRGRKAESPYAERPLELIDPPSLAMRETFDEAGLAELAESIRQVGVVLPIKLRSRGARFEIIDGHRRYVASLMAGRQTIPSVAVDVGDDLGEALKAHANYWREDVNPAEEAVWFSRLLETHCEGDVDRLCTMLHLKRSYVEDRLLLLEADAEIIAAVREKRIGFGHARELQQVRDRSTRLMYLDSAIRGGATVRLIREWRQRANAAPAGEAPPPSDGLNQHTGTPAPAFTMSCLCCGSDDAPWEMELIYVHRRCRGMFLDPYMARLRGELPAGAAGQAPAEGA